jgi:hypothetical protein
MNRVPAKQQVLQRFGQVVPGGRLAGPYGIAAKRRKDARGQNGAGRRALQEAEIGMPVAAKHAAALVRALVDADHLRIGVHRLYVGQ